LLAKIRLAKKCPTATNALAYFGEPQIDVSKSFIAEILDDEQAVALKKHSIVSLIAKTSQTREH
jgi:hypothetical protein